MQDTRKNKLEQVANDLSFLTGWKLRLAIVTMLLTPTVAATGAYYNIKSDVVDRIEKVQAHIDEKYVSRDSFNDMKENLKDVRDDVKEIKRILMIRPGK